MRRHEAQRAAWAEFHAGDLDRHRDILTELAWRSRAQSAARTVDPPAWLTGLLGDPPTSVRGRHAWRRAAEQIQGYRDRHHVDGDGLGAPPDDLAAYREWRACHDAIDRVHSRGCGVERDPRRGMSRGIS